MKPLRQAPRQGAQKDFVEGDLVCRDGMKRCYFGSVEASKMKALREAKGSPPLRIYRCPICGFLHLTSQRAEVGRRADGGGEP